MTEKERHEAFYDASNWIPATRFPSSDVISIREFEFYRLSIYDLRLLARITWDHEHMRSCDRIGWEHKFYFIKEESRKGTYYRVVSMTEIWRLMKKSEEDEEHG